MPPDPLALACLHNSAIKMIYSKFRTPLWKSLVTGLYLATSVLATSVLAKWKIQKILQDLKDKQQNNTLLYDQIVQLDNTVTKDALELQSNPAHGSSHKVTIGSNSTYV